MANDRHPGITMHKIRFGGGFVGFLFAAGSALIFVLGFPTLWYFVALALGLGIAIAVLLHIFSRRISQRNRPLSILASSESQAPQCATEKKAPLHRIFLRLASV
jgi:hypothetical protein